MMSVLFNIIALTSIWVLGITIITQEGMILEGLRRFGERFSEDRRTKILEPIYMCHWCMPSIHSIMGYFFAYHLGVINSLGWTEFIMYPLVAMGSSLTCGLVWAFYSWLNAMTEHLKS